MDGDSQATLFTILILLILAAFFAITETALSSVSRNKVKIAAERGDSRAGSVMYAIEHFDRAITTLLICTNIVHISIASIVTVWVTRRWGLSFVSVSTIITTIVVFFVGEMVPKSIGKKNSEGCAYATAGILLLLMKLCTPASAILSAIGNLVARLTKEEPEISVTEDELYDIIEDMEEKGAIDEEQSELFTSALEFSEVTADSIITPRVDMVGIDIEDDAEEIFEVIRSTNHSRIPVYRGDNDHIEGVLLIRKYMKAYLKSHTYPDIASMMDAAYFVPQGTQIDELLENMSRKKVSMAVIKDHYGGTMGIVTIEDILEELVGEIWDEDDHIEESVVRLSEQIYRFDAEETVGDAFYEMDVEAQDEEDEEDFTNLLIGEWVFTQFAEIPKVGDSFVYQNLTITVDEMEKNRIRFVRIECPRQEKEEKGGEE